MTLKTWRTENDWHHGHHASSGFNHDAKIGYAEFSYHNGLFSEYGSYKDVSVSEQEGREKLGFQGIGKFPIPDYVSTFARDNELYDALQDKSNYDALNSNNRYHLEWAADMLLAVHDPELKEDVCPDYKQLKNDPYHSFMEEHWGYGFDMEQRARQFSFAASWMHMPADERQKYYEAFTDVVKEHDEKVIKSAEERGWPVREDELYSKTAGQLKDMFLSTPKCPDDIYAVGIPKIEDTPYAEFLPWAGLEDVKDFEAAVAGISEPDEQMGL